MQGGAGPGEDKAAFGTKSAELAVAGLFLAFGALVVWDSARLGASWGPDGPRPGYFPFYIGLIICVSAVINLVRAVLIPAAKDKPFVLVGQLKLVLTVLIPTAIYAALVTWIGLYVSSALFIGFFMRWLGRYAWWKTLVTSVASVVAFYLIFEFWFKVPLPKGPVEVWLGIN